MPNPKTRIKPVVMWAVVESGTIIFFWMDLTRSSVIEMAVKSFRGSRRYEANSHLTDSQFWRLLKRREGLSVQRVRLSGVRG